MKLYTCQLCKLFFKVAHSLYRYYTPWKRILFRHIASRNEFTFKSSDIFSDARDPGGCSPEGFTHEILYRKPEERLRQG